MAKCFDKPKYTEQDLTRQDKEGKTYKIDAELKFDEELNDFISRKLLAKIYESSDFNGVQLNSSVSKKSHNIISRTLFNFGKAVSYNKNLSDYLTGDLLTRVNEGQLANGIVSYKKLKTIVRNYRKKLAEEKFVSFQKSQMFTASRIPA